MPSALVLPTRSAPSNLRLRDTVRARVVTHDMYDICSRIQELDPSLFILELEENGASVYAVVEQCVDGVERLVFRVDSLDGRVVEKLRYLMAMPLDERVRELERVEHKANLDAEEYASEKLYEEMGRPMMTELERCGFTGPRGVSYPKAGVTGGKGSQRRA